MASTRAPAAKRRRSGQSRLSHRAAPRAPSDAVFMLKLTPRPVTGATKVATAGLKRNGPSRLCDAPSPGTMRNDFSIARRRLDILADWQTWASQRPKRRAASMIIRVGVEAKTLGVGSGGRLRPGNGGQGHVVGCPRSHPSLRDRLTSAGAAPYKPRDRGPPKRLPLQQDRAQETLP